MLVPAKNTYEKKLIVKSLTQFNESLIKLDSDLNPNLAKAIGLYLLKNLSINEVFSLL